MSTALQTKTNGHEIALASSPTSWLDDPNKVRLIKDTIAVGTSDDELSLFLEVCRATGLNPFQRQIFCIMRNEWDSTTRTSKPKMTIQTSIDGFRLIAARTGQHAGTEDAELGPPNKDGYPSWAKTTVYRMLPSGHVAKFSATARWEEYRQVTKEGKLMGLWGKMPATMICKCSEALALRKGFPAELSGLYTKDEMGQAENEVIEAKPVPAPVGERKAAPAPTPAPAPKNVLFEDWRAKLDAFRLLDLPEFDRLLVLFGLTSDTVDTWSIEEGSKVYGYVRLFANHFFTMGTPKVQVYAKVADFIKFVASTEGAFTREEPEYMIRLMDDYLYAVRKSED
jgi:phage recombination protein Bet